MDARILVVEDDDSVGEFVQRGLQAEGYQADRVSDGEAGLELLSRVDYALVIMDVMLPGKSGLEVVRELRRRRHEVPVLALTARGELDDRVAGLEAGCDDYLPKPFAFQELLARIKALVRRAGVADRMAKLSYRDLVLDPGSRTVTRGGKRIELTNKEYQLLEYLMRRPEAVITRAELLEQVWGYDFETPSNVLEVYMNFLRRKVDVPFDRRLLNTVRGVGYILREED